jgi:hypothetical protein
MGYSPSVQDDENLWCIQRDRVNGASPNSIVLEGHSRIHQAWAPGEFAKVAPGFEQIQLGFFKSEPISVVRDIAENTEYSGVVLCSVLSFSLLPENWRPIETDKYRCHVVDFYHNNWSINEKTDRTVSSYWQGHFVASFPELSPHKVAPDLLRGDWPIQYVFTEADRTQRVDYRRIDLTKFAERQFRFLLDNTDKCVQFESYKTWPKDTGYEDLDRYVKMIQDRGGHVVFLRPVTSGEFEEHVEGLFPREEFWDRFAQNTSAETIHFRDIPALASMTCPDGSHLSLKDSRTFTRVIAEELVRRKIISVSP